MLNPLVHFWICHPALFYAISFLLGIFCRLEGIVKVLLPYLSLSLPFLIGAFSSKNYRILKYLILSLLMFAAAWITTAVYYVFPTLPNRGIQGNAHIKIKNISSRNNFFGERWVYRCEIQQFFPFSSDINSTHSIAYFLPCIISLPKEGGEYPPQPLIHEEYWVEGRLIQSEDGSYRLKISSKTKWQAIKTFHSLAEHRFQWKSVANKWIESNYTHFLSASFLSGLVVGELDDIWMRQQFARFGLQHLLAISGFHFAVIAGFLNFALRLFFSRKISAIILFSCLGGYFLFLGVQASILRAWVMCSLTLLAILVDKQTTALNSLGIALLAVLSFNPLFCCDLGFQLSFGTTAAILLFYQPSQIGFHSLFPKKRLHEVLKMNFLNQYGYCVLAFLREGLALMLAVNIFALPLTIYYFYQFPWVGLFYNLFFPLLASGSLCLLLIAGIFSFIPFIGGAIHQLNDIYTFFILQLTCQIPQELDIYLSSDSLNPFWLIAYLCLIHLLGIIWKETSCTKIKSNVFTFI